MSDPEAGRRTAAAVLESVQGGGPALAWRGVCYAVRAQGDGKVTKVVLSDVSGAVAAGEVCFIMGPSGAGKSTLLDALGDRISHQNAAGQVRIPKNDGVDSTMRPIAYVQQQDALPAVLTARQVLTYAAELATGDRDEAARRCEDTAAMLGLTEHLDTMCGGPLTRGLSGGQRRRVSIGEQLVNLPRVLLLDEPTSGLDAAAAYHIVKVLNKLARTKGVAVVLTIHQPSEAVLALADTVHLLSCGRTAYFGSPRDLATHFKQLGCSLPPHTSRAEWALHLIDTSFSEKEQVTPLLDAWPSSPAAGEVGEKLRVLGDAEAMTFVTDASVNPPPMARQLHVLIRRQMIHMLLNPAAIALRFAMYVALSIMIGTVWLDIGSNASVITDIINVLFFIAAFMVFMSISVLPAFLDEKELFIKERANGSVGTASYMIAHFVVDLPFLFALAAVCGSICFYLTGVGNGPTHFGHFVLNLWLSFVVAESLMLLIASIVPFFIVGIAAGAFAFGAFMVVQGFFIKIELIGWWWRWMHYIGLHSYSFSSLLYVQFHNQTYPCVNGQSGMWQCVNVSGMKDPVVRGDDVLALYDFDDTDVAQNYVVLACMAVAYRVLAAVWVHTFHTGKR